MTPRGAVLVAALAAALVLGGIASATSAPERAGSERTRAAGLEDVRRFAPGIALDLRYAGPENVTGQRLQGYCRRWALLDRDVARDLAQVQRRLRRSGYGLAIYDAYRPARASRALVRWARRSGRGELVGTYIAEWSNHNLGGAVDLTLLRLRDGRRLRMGTGHDDLSARANTYNARGPILRNRLVLVRAMKRFGFSNYAREWWHFDHPAAGSRYLDVPLGCSR